MTAVEIGPEYEQALPHGIEIHRMVKVYFEVETETVGLHLRYFNPLGEVVTFVKNNSCDRDRGSCGNHVEKGRDPIRYPGTYVFRDLEITDEYGNRATYRASGEVERNNGENTSHSLQVPDLIVDVSP